MDLGERRSVHRNRARAGVHRLPADFAPVASMARTALSITSGPIPSPHSSVIVLGHAGPDCTRLSDADAGQTPWTES